MQTNRITLIVGTIVTIAVLVIAYQSLIVVPKERIAAQERANVEKVRLERLEKLQKAEAYDQCIASAYQVYSQNWDKACETNGKEADCSLYSAQSDRIDDMHQTAKTTCLTLYK